MCALKASEKKRNICLFNKFCVFFYSYIYIYIYIYDSEIVHNNPCFNLLILHNNLFDDQANEINKNDIFLPIVALVLDFACN